MRKALLVGINNYDYINNLRGCENDVKAMQKVLGHHLTEGQKKNFDIETFSTEDFERIERTSLKDRIEELFRDPREISLLYFSGHGHIESTGGYLITTESKRGDSGLSMFEILTMANSSPAMSKIIILDCCHAGGFTQNPLTKDLSTISRGVTVFAASDHNQYSMELGGRGVFTHLFVDAMNGGASTILGEITTGGVYGYVDKAMGEKGQRPLFITNIRRYTILREIDSQISRTDIRKLVKIFHRGPSMEIQLDPAHEYTQPEASEKKVKIFQTLQKYNRVGLVIPIGETYMYYAALNRKSCKLTPLGKSYWKLVKNNVV